MFFYDGNGNIAQLVDSIFLILRYIYSYDPFGNLISFSANITLENLFMFSSKYYDVETKLYYYGYRYYFLELGKWICRDPINEKGFKLKRKKVLLFDKDLKKSIFNPYYLFIFR